MVVVKWSDNFFGRPQFDFYDTLRTAFIAGLDQSIIAVSGMRNAPVVRVIPKKSQ